MDKSYTVWWCNNHLEKYEFVNGKDYPIYEMENKIHVPNHQPVWDLVTCWFPVGNLMFRIGDHKKRHWKDIGGPHSWKAPMAGCFICMLGGMRYSGDSPFDE